MRKRLAFKAQCLVRLQTFFRGWVGRNEATAKRRDRDRELRKAYFDLCATTIQRHWRGHYSRINIHDFQARKAYLQAVVEKGKQVREESTLLAEVRRASIQPACQHGHHSYRNNARRLVRVLAGHPSAAGLGGGAYAARADAPADAADAPPGVDGSAAGCAEQPVHGHDGAVGDDRGKAR